MTYDYVFLGSSKSFENGVGGKRKERNRMDAAQGKVAQSARPPLGCNRYARK